MTKGLCCAWTQGLLADWSDATACTPVLIIHHPTAWAERRWVNCLLLREVPFHLGFRLWDTYLAEGRGMKEFLVYVAASFLLHWGPALQHAEFQVRARSRLWWGQGCRLPCCLPARCERDMGQSWALCLQSLLHASVYVVERCRVGWAALQSCTSGVWLMRGACRRWCCSCRSRRPAAGQRRRSN